MSAPPSQRGRDLLPNSSTPLERVVADLKFSRAGTIDTEVVRRVIDPWACPLPLLPWLAEAMSVDVWDDAWPEQTKRRVIAASPEVHRIKGTRKAVRLALQALGLDSTITEWWETTPPARRGTFAVAVHADGSGPPLDLTLIRTANVAVRRAKPKSRVFTLAVALEARAPIVVGASLHGIARITLLPRLDPRPDATAPVRVAGVYDVAERRILVLPRPVGTVPAAGPVTLASAYGAGARSTTLYPRDQADLA